MPSIETIVYTLREQTCTAWAFACARSFGIGLALADGQKLECFKLTVNNIFI
jgi:hypothetical protein